MSGDVGCFMALFPLPLLLLLLLPLFTMLTYMSDLHLCFSAFASAKVTSEFSAKKGAE